MEITINEGRFFKLLKHAKLGGTQLGGRWIQDQQWAFEVYGDRLAWYHGFHSVRTLHPDECQALSRGWMSWSQFNVEQKRAALRAETLPMNYDIVEREIWHDSADETQVIRFLGEATQDVELIRDQSIREMNKRNLVLRSESGQVNNQSEERPSPAVLDAGQSEGT